MKTENYPEDVEDEGRTWIGNPVNSDNARSVRDFIRDSDEPSPYLHQLMNEYDNYMERTGEQE